MIVGALPEIKILPYGRRRRSSERTKTLFIDTTIHQKHVIVKFTYLAFLSRRRESIRLDPAVGASEKNVFLSLDKIKSVGHQIAEWGVGCDRIVAERAACSRVHSGVGRDESVALGIRDFSGAGNVEDLLVLVKCAGGCEHVEPTILPARESSGDFGKMHLWRHVRLDTLGYAGGEDRAIVADTADIAVLDGEVHIFYAVKLRNRQPHFCYLREMRKYQDQRDEYACDYWQREFQYKHSAGIFTGIVIRAPNPAEI